MGQATLLKRAAVAATGVESGELRRADLWKSAAVGALFTLALILAVSRGDVDRMTYGDGPFYTYVAAHMDAGPGDLDPVVASRGPSLRYGRIGLPAMIWLLSAGRPSAMLYAQPIVMVIAGAAVAAASAALIRGIGVRAALLPFLAIGLSLALTGGYVEPLAIAATVLAVVFAARGRWIHAALAMSFAMLTRETMGMVAVGLVAWCWTRGERRAAATMAASVVPLGIWHAVVASRFGYFPVNDPYLRAEGGAPIPFLSLGRTILQGTAPAIAIAVVHLGLAVVVVTQWRRSALGAAAAGSALQAAVVPRLTWEYYGDTLRTFATLETFAVLLAASIVAHRVNSKAASSTAVSTEGTSSPG